ncbi:MAG: hypothetical protein E6R04_06705 [Spirochaetes bacterium]|nr:MAG: hypothetical protein E6R04_06705 [Spirochaetota bacterium]
MHPIRWAKRKLRTTTRKVTALVVLMGGAGSGSVLVAPDSLPGQFGAEVVTGVHRLVELIPSSQ